MRRAFLPTHLYKDGEYVVLLDPDEKDALQKSTGYNEELVMRITRYAPESVWLESVGNVVGLCRPNY